LELTTIRGRKKGADHHAAKLFRVESGKRQKRGQSFKKGKSRQGVQTDFEGDKEREREKVPEAPATKETKRKLSVQPGTPPEEKAPEVRMGESI